MSDDGSVSAGVFTRYNDAPLSSGDRYPIETRQPDHIVIRQPLGPDTDLTAEPLSHWDLAVPIAAWAYSADGTLLGVAPTTITAHGVIFTYRRQMSSGVAQRYEIFQAHGVLLPIVVKIG